MKAINQSMEQQRTFKVPPSHRMLLEHFPRLPCVRWKCPPGQSLQVAPLALASRFQQKRDGATEESSCGFQDSKAVLVPTVPRDQCDTNHTRPADNNFAPTQFIPSMRAANSEEAEANSEEAETNSKGAETPDRNSISVKRCRTMIVGTVP